MKNLLKDKRVIAGVVFLVGVVTSAVLVKKGMDEVAEENDVPFDTES